MSKIVKNTTASNVFITDTGITVAASDQYIIPPQDYLTWAASSDIVTFIGDGTIVINDGSTDLTKSDGINLIKGIFPSEINLENVTSTANSLQTWQAEPQWHTITDSLKNIELLLKLQLAKKNELEDGNGTGRVAALDNLQALKTIDSRLPVVGDPTKVKIFRQYFKNNGSTDMRVNGSTTAVDFVIEADPVNDRYIDTVSWLIADVNADLNDFGNLAPLTNGVQIIYSDNDLGDVIIGDNLKTNFDIIRLCAGQPSFGAGIDAFQAGNAAGNSEGYIPTLDFGPDGSFGLPWGIRLRAGTSEKLIIRIRDNVTGIDAFDAVAHGFDRLP